MSSCTGCGDVFGTNRGLALHANKCERYQSKLAQKRARHDAGLPSDPSDSDSDDELDGAPPPKWALHILRELLDLKALLKGKPCVPTLAALPHTVPV